MNKFKHIYIEFINVISVANIWINDKEGGNE